MTPRLLPRLVPHIVQIQRSFTVELVLWLYDLRVRVKKFVYKTIGCSVLTVWSLPAEEIANLEKRVADQRTDERTDGWMDIGQTTSS